MLLRRRSLLSRALHLIRAPSPPPPSNAATAVALCRFSVSLFPAFACSARCFLMRQLARPHGCRASPRILFSYRILCLSPTLALTTNSYHQARPVLSLLSLPPVYFPLLPERLPALYPFFSSVPLPLHWRSVGPSTLLRELEQT
jgi:hypothetical protein